MPPAWRILGGVAFSFALTLLACAADSGTGNLDGGHFGTQDGGDGGKASYVRVHYRLPGAGNPQSWGVHFWGAGATSPTWGQPQLFSFLDDFGGYTDIPIQDVNDSKDAWLGLIPVQCTAGNCQKDVETSVRFFDLDKNSEKPNIAECWITQGQAVAIHKPSQNGPDYRIYRPKEFIDLGNGTVRLMFRVAPGASGEVRYGISPTQLDRQVSFSAADDINRNGLLLTGLIAGSPISYQIRSTLQNPSGEMQRDETAVLTLTPIAFDTIRNAADWAGWGAKSVMYQLIVRSFADGGTMQTVADGDKESGINPAARDGIGDLVGLRSMLPYLKDLGVDAIWMTPVFKAKSYHGYDTTDFYDIDPAVGTRKDFVDLSTAAHTLGIKLVLDLVQNHVADVNPWFVAAISPQAANHAKYKDWFVWSDAYTNMRTDPHPFDSSAVIWACKNYACYHQIFGAAMPELNFRNPEVRAEMKKIAAYWLQLGADGFRLDASKHIDQFDDNNSILLGKHGTHVWWKEFNHFVKKQVSRDASLPAVILAGENRWDDPAVASKMIPYAGDMDSQFDFPFRSFLSNFLTGQTGASVDFATYLSQLQTASGVVDSGGNPNHFFERFLSNHDLDRPATQFAAAPGPHTALLQLAATIVLTVPGMPVIYYGEELGKQGKRDKYLGSESYAHDEFIREPMSWYNLLHFTGDMQQKWDIDFLKSNSDNAALLLPAGICKAANADYPFIKFMAADDENSYAAQKDDPTSLLQRYKQLIAIRKSNPLMTDSSTQLTTVTNTAEVYEFQLSNAGQKLAVVLNRKPAAQVITRPLPAQDLLTGVTGTSFQVTPYGALILKDE